MANVENNYNLVGKMTGEGLFMGCSYYTKENVPYVTYYVVQGTYDPELNMFVSAEWRSFSDQLPSVDSKVSYKFMEKVRFDVEARSFGNKTFLSCSNLRKY